MRVLLEEVEAFDARKRQAAVQAGRLAAAQLVCGIDLSTALGAESELRARYIRRIERAIERERLKGMRQHWSYDLNRHIALKQALDLLRGPKPGQERLNASAAAGMPTACTKNNGARRRRRSI